MASLRKFLYLDEKALDDYLSVLEDGLRQGRELSTDAASSREGSVGGKYAKVGADKSTGSQEHTSWSDTAPARFERLVTLASADEELTGWAELPQLDQLDAVGVGALIHVECEIYVPEIIRALTGGGFAEAMEQLEQLAPVAKALGLPMDDMPDMDEARQMSAVSGMFKAGLVVVGEDDSDWRIAGQLNPTSVRDDDLEGSVRVVGKVARRWAKGAWKPLLALPGSTLMSRDERRRLEREKPDTDDGSALEGPAVMIDVLAVYR